MQAQRFAQSIFDDIVGELFDVPVMGNQLRPHYVERMVVAALGPGFVLTSADWTGWDIEHASGVRVEVKQSAALQPWSGHFANRTGAPQTRRFDIAPRTGFWTDGGARWVERPGRLAEIYIFAWHPVTDTEQADQRDPEQWRFFVVPSAGLPDGQKTIAVGVVEATWNAVGFRDLRAATLTAIDRPE